MINLLPPDNRKAIRAGYSNTLLVRYTILSIGALVFLLLALGVTYFVLAQSQRLAETTQAENQSQAAGFSQTKAESDKLRRDLANTKQLFDSQVKYSQILLNLAAILPDGTALTALDLSTDDIASPTALTIQIRDRSAAEQLEKNLSNSPYISNVTLGSISTNPDGGGLPYQADVTLTLDRSIAQ